MSRAHPFDLAADIHKEMPLGQPKPSPYEAMMVTEAMMGGRIQARKLIEACSPATTKAKKPEKIEKLMKLVAKTQALIILSARL
jgi:hypothetical protein